MSKADQINARLLAQGRLAMTASELRKYGKAR